MSWAELVHGASMQLFDARLGQGFRAGAKKSGEIRSMFLCLYIYIYRPQYILYNLYIDRYMLADRYIDFNHSEESLHE